MLPLTIIASGLGSRSFSSNAKEDIGSGDGTPRALNAVISKSKLWPNGMVYYDDRKFSAKDKSFIKEQLDHITQKTGNCVRFQAKTSGHRVSMHKDSKKGCYASIGYQSNQTMNLAPGCMKPGTVQHEFLHSLGIYHAQARYDRDVYLDIITSEIKGKKKSINFKKLSESEVTHFELPYDYGSVMHYRSTAFSKSGERTILTKDSSKQGIIGQRNGISDGDVLLIKSLYSCITKNECIGYKNKNYCTNEYKDWMDTVCVGTCSKKIIVSVTNPSTNGQTPPRSKCDDLFAKGACKPESSQRRKQWMTDNCEEKYHCQNQDPKR